MATSAEIARALNVSARRVFQLASDGVLPRAGRGRYELRACVRAYIAFLNRAIAAKADPETSAIAASTLRSRTRRLAAQADMLRRKNLAEAADLVREDLVAREFRGCIAAHARRTRELLVQKLPPALEGLTIDERRALMDDAAYELLLRLVNWRPPAAKGLPTGRTNTARR